MMTLLPRPWRHVIPPCTCSFRSALVAAGQSWVFSRQFRVSEASPESSPLGLFSSFLLACWGQGPQGWGITCLGSCPCSSFSCCTTRRGSSHYIHHPVLPGTLPSLGSKLWDWRSLSSGLWPLEERGSQDILLFFRCTPLRGSSEATMRVKLPPLHPWPLAAAPHLSSRVEQL